MLKKRLEAEAFSMALTTDIWTSIATEAYMTVTCHYIDQNLQLQNFVLETLAFPERHTGGNIADKLKGVGERWGITHKVIIVSHDQGSNMEAAMEVLTNDCNWQSLPCCAHRLQLCLLAGLKINAIDKLIGAVKKIVSHFSHSVVATEALKNKQQQMNITAKKLINSCPTRWNSTYEMLQRVLKLRWPVTAVLSDDTITKRSDRYLDLKTEQWKLTEDLVAVLEPFTIATTFFSYEENVSISSVFAILHGLLEKLKPKEDSASECSDSKIIKDFKETVTLQIVQRFELQSLHSAHPLLIGSLLDPRFKNITLSKFKEGEIQTLKNGLIELMEVAKEQASEATEESSGDSQGTMNTNDPATPPAKKEKLTALDVLLGPEQLSLDSTLENELKKYLAEAPVPRKENPLSWWKANATRFKTLPFVARRLLCMPAASTSAERVFSTAGLTITKLRSNLKPKNADALIFLSKNLSKLL